MAGYSKTPLAKKLGVEPGSVLSLVAAPEGWAVPELPAGVRVRAGLRGHPDVIVVFLRSLRDLRHRAPGLPSGLVDTKVAALDDDWSGLKFVWRKERRAELERGEAQRQGWS